MTTDTLEKPANQAQPDANAVRDLQPVNVQDTALLAALADSSAPLLPLALAKSLDRYDDKKKRWRSDTVKRSLIAFQEQGLVELGEGDAAATLTERGRAIWRAMSGEATAPGPDGAFSVTHGQVDADPDNPRQHFADGDLDSLAADIADKGLLQNIIIRPHPTSAGRFMLVGGERRWRAIGRLIEQNDTRWPADRPIPALVRDYAAAPDQSAAIDALVENMQRVQLDPMEEARAFDRLVKAGLKTKDLAARVGRTQRNIQQRLKLLELPVADQQAVAEGRMTVEEARKALAKPAQPAAPRLPDRDSFGGNADIWAAKIKAATDRFKASDAAQTTPNLATFWTELFKCADGLDLGRYPRMSIAAMTDLMRAIHDDNDDTVGDHLDAGVDAGWIMAQPNAFWSLTDAAQDATRPAPPEDDIATILQRARARTLDALEELQRLVVPELAVPNAHNLQIDLLEKVADSIQSSLEKEKAK
jgi:ParB/RepB/Spo0J family partition protein